MAMERGNGVENRQDGGRGIVVLIGGGASGLAGGHECMTRGKLAERLAELQGFAFAGEYDAACHYDRPLYFVPGATLVGIDTAHALGIRDERGLFGGVVPHAFVATKTITHALPAPGAQAPPGWSESFAHGVNAATLPGYSAFSPQDALLAGLRLLERGAVRLKIAGGIGGLGQSVARDADELRARIADLQEREEFRDGVVLELNLEELTTLSVGQVRVGALTATYYGTQRLTVSNVGEQVYGGSELVVVRGEFDALLRQPLPQEVRIAVDQARVYHDAAIACFPGMFASRCNYDIAQGVDAQGSWRSGVLEQSWRIGGASGAEILALDAFRRDPACQLARASTVEIYGGGAEIPPDALVTFCGIDERVGPLTKYARVDTD